MFCLLLLTNLTELFNELLDTVLYSSVWLCFSGISVYLEEKGDKLFGDEWRALEAPFCTAEKWNLWILRTHSYGKQYFQIKCLGTSKIIMKKESIFWHTHGFHFWIRKAISLNNYIMSDFYPGSFILTICWELWGSTCPLSVITLTIVKRCISLWKLPGQQYREFFALSQVRGDVL